jgi:methionine--tRNA ligase beta chain
MTPETPAPDPAAAPPPPPAAPAGPATIAIDQFKAVDLRTARVVEVREHPNADRLWIVTADLGDGKTRTIVAGLRKEVPREELLGKTVIVVANLAPAMLRGVESQGMILAVKTPTGVRPLTTLGEAGPGLQVT